MNKLYIIAPVILFAIFGVIYYNSAQHHKVEIVVKAKQVAAAKLAEDTKKKEAEAKARADADERTAKRVAEEKKKEEEKRAKYEAQSKEIADSTAKYSADANKYSKQGAELEIQLAEMRKKKDASARDAFELTKQVELAKIAKRNAELEIQRMTKMVAEKAGNSSVAKPPAPAAVVKNP